MNNAVFGFDVIFNYATLGILVTDTEGNIVLANPFLLRHSATRRRSCRERR